MFLKLSLTLLDQLIPIAAIGCQHSYYLSQKLEQKDQIKCTKYIRIHIILKILLKNTVNKMT